MSLISDFELITNSQFKGRVAIAVLRAAANVRNESPSTPNHAERLIWANGLTSYAAADIMAGRFLPNVVANPTISAAGPAATDGDVQFTVNGLVDVYALNPQ